MTRHEAIENLFVAMDTLRSHKVRSGLTILGIVIGVTSVITVASIIEGLNRFVQNKVDSLGSRTYFVSRLPAGTDPNRLPLKIRIRKYLDFSDAAYLRETCPDIATATTFGTRAFFFGQTNVISYEGQRVERVFLRGAEPELAEAIPAYTVGQGRFISRYDEDHARAVVVLGIDIADSLFPHSDPMGKQVRLNGQLFEVIGVFEKDSGFFGAGGINQFAMIPLNKFHKDYPDTKEWAIAFTAPRDGDVQKAKDEVTEALRRRRHVPFKAENDFEIISPGFHHGAVEQSDRRAGDPDRHHQLGGIAGGRHRSDEHHADLRDRADERNRRAQGHRGAQIGYPAAVFDGSDRAFVYRRRHRNHAGGDYRVPGTNSDPFDSRNAFAAVGGVGGRDFSGGGGFLRLLSGESRGEFGSDCGSPL